MELPPLDHPATIPAVLHAAAERFGDRDFVVMADRRLTFASAEAASREVAKDLLARGVGKGAKVAMLDTFSTEWVVCWLAAARIGAVFVPLASTMKPPEARWTLRHADVALLVIPPTVLGTDLYEFAATAVPGLADAGPGPLYLPEMPFLREVASTVPGGPPWATHLELPTDALPPAARAIGPPPPVRSTTPSWSRWSPRCGPATPWSSSTPRGRPPSPRGPCTPTAAWSVTGPTCCATRARGPIPTSGASPGSPSSGSGA